MPDREIIDSWTPELSIQPHVRSSAGTFVFRARSNSAIIQNSWGTSAIWKFERFPHLPFSFACLNLNQAQARVSVLYRHDARSKIHSIRHLGENFHSLVFRLRFNSYHSPTLRRSFIPWQRDDDEESRPPPWIDVWLIVDTFPFAGTSTKRKTRRREKKIEPAKGQNASIRREEKKEVVLGEHEYRFRSAVICTTLSRRDNVQC